MNLRKIKTWQWIVLALMLLAALDWFIQRPDGRARELNHILQSQGSQRMKNYPYRFHVLRVENDTAIMATPRNFDVPALHFIRALHPDIDVMDNNNPAFIAAEKALGEMQSEARNIVLSQSDINNVKWELDKAWLKAHHIDIPAAQ